MKKSDPRPYLYVLDDEPDQAMLVGLAAQRSGEFADVRTAIDSQLAYHHLLEVADDPEHRPSLIMIDWKMPRMHGADFAAALQEHPELRNIPVIVMSNSGDEADRTLALECGCKALYQKPSAFAELVDLLIQIRRQYCALRTPSGETPFTARPDDSNFFADRCGSEAPTF
ncbi:MAG TPA: response regulator [Opitutaceae bacterium]|nr:response regulator [Opitutaceae bacterium]